MRKETKIAIFAIVTLALAIWGYKYLNGFNILSKKLVLYANYTSVEGVRMSTPVTLRGVQVGLVSDISQDPKDFDSTRVEFQIDPEYNIPADAEAQIVTSFMGGASINIAFDGNCTNGDCAKSGDYLRGVALGAIGSYVTPEELKDYVDEVNKGLQSVLDTLTGRIKNSEELNKSMKDLQATFANLNSATGKLDRMLSNNGTLDKSLKNFETITTTLKESNQQIKDIINSAQGLTADLDKANVNEVTDEAKTTLKKLQSTMANSDKAIADLSAILANLKNGEGAIGMLMNDPAFANSLQTAVKDMQLLMQDIRLHPERYRRILSKKEMPYEAPENDPARNQNPKN